MEHKRPSCSKRWVPTTKCMKAPNRTSSSSPGNALAAGAKDHGSSRAAVRTRGNGVRFRVKGASERLKENRERAHRLTPNPKARPHPIYPKARPHPIYPKKPAANAITTPRDQLGASNILLFLEISVVFRFRSQSLKVFLNGIPLPCV